jgi:hypothetical protein
MADAAKSDTAAADTACSSSKCIVRAAPAASSPGTCAVQTRSRRSARNFDGFQRKFYFAVQSFVAQSFAAQSFAAQVGNQFCSTAHRAGSQGAPASADKLLILFHLLASEADARGRSLADAVARKRLHQVLWNQNAGSEFAILMLSGKGDPAMTSKDDLGASHVPPIDWMELSVWALFIASASALALVFVR